VATVDSLDVLAPEQRFECDSFEEALEACVGTFHYDRTEIAIDQISLDDSLILDFQGEPHLLTSQGFADICRLVKVPPKFASSIPLDLTAEILDRLKVLHQQAALVIRRGNVIVAVVDPLKWTQSRAKQRRPRYEPVSVSRLLQVVQKVWTPQADWLRIAISDSGVQVELVGEARLLEPRIGDVSGVGIAVTGSETGGPMPQARGYTLRLACTNGAAIPESFGLLRFSTDWRVKFELRLRGFQAKLQEFTVDHAVLTTTYEQLVSENLTDNLFESLHRQARYIYRHSPRPEEFADRALGVEREQRLRIVSPLRRRRADLRAGMAAPALQQSTSLLAWDVFNNITSSARREASLPRKTALERLAGDLLHVYRP